MKTITHRPISKVLCGCGEECVDSCVRQSGGTSISLSSFPSLPPPKCVHMYIHVQIYIYTPTPFHLHIHNTHTGKFGDGSDVTTWKINFRCALNGLKDIIERRELEEPDCRVYQMLPSSNTGRRRKRRRTYYSEMLSFQPPDKDMRTRPDPLSPNGSLMSTPTPTSSMSSWEGREGEWVGGRERGRREGEWEICVCVAQLGGRGYMNLGWVWLQGLGDVGVCLDSWNGN